MKFFAYILKVLRIIKLLIDQLYLQVKGYFKALKFLYREITGNDPFNEILFWLSLVIAFFYVINK